MSVAKIYNTDTAQWEAIIVGDQGPIGYTGSQGNVGFTGSAGVTGSQGVLPYNFTVGPTAPSTPVLYDIWIDTN
jgi:hypothetical protein